MREEDTWTKMSLWLKLEEAVLKSEVVCISSGWTESNVNVVTDGTEEAWDLIMDVNLKGPFLCCKNVIPHTVARREGKIVNIGSIDGRIGVPLLAHYVPSKAGLHMLTDTLAREVSAHNINVNCVATGAVWTPMLEGFLKLSTPESGIKEAFEKVNKTLHEFGREVTAEDAANAVLFLVTEESRNMTGYTLYVDGGWKRSL